MCLFRSILNSSSAGIGTRRRRAILVRSSGAAGSSSTGPAKTDKKRRLVKAAKFLIGFMVVVLDRMDCIECW